jgi:hypothetical protein
MNVSKDGVVGIINHPLMLLESALCAYGHPGILSAVAAINGMTTRGGRDFQGHRTLSVGVNCVESRGDAWGATNFGARGGPGENFIGMNEGLFHKAAREGVPTGWHQVPAARRGPRHCAHAR